MAVGSVAAVGLAGAAAVTAAARTAGAVKATSVAVAGTATAVSGVAHAASGLSVAKLVGAAVTVPAAVMSAIAAASGTAAAVGTLGTVVYFGAIGAGCGVALGTGGAVSSAMAWLMNDARDPALYVIGDQLVPLDWMRSISKLTTGADGSSQAACSAPSQAAAPTAALDEGRLPGQGGASSLTRSDPRVTVPVLDK